MPTSQTTTFTRGKNFNPISKESLPILNQVLSNLWQISTIKDSKWLAESIFPKSEYGHITNHFEGKLAGYMSQYDTTTAFVWWIGAMTENYKVQVYAWLNAKQF